MNSNESEILRTLTVAFGDAFGNALKDLVGGILCWFFPKNNTMITTKPDDNKDNYEYGDVPEAYKEGLEDFECYSTMIQNSEAATADEDGEATPTIKPLDIKYHIATDYNTNYTNNYVICRLFDKHGEKMWQAEQSFGFSSFGSNGTPYTLSVNPSSGQRTMTTKKGLPLLVKVLNQDGATVPIKNLSYKWNGILIPDLEISNKDSDNITLVEKDNGNNTKIVTIKKTMSGILEIKASIDEKKENGTTSQIRLSYSYPVPFGNENYTFNGPTRITYNSNGVTPQIENTVCKVLDINGKEVMGLAFSITGNSKNAPRLDSNGSVIANSYYDSKDTTFPVITVTKNNSKTRASEVILEQPIIVSQKSYESNYLNDWDGSLTIDNANNRISAASLVAGSHDTDNKFTGVVIGDTEFTESNKTTMFSGVLGFKAGAQTFGLNTDGTAFMGKSGKGRIDFNGD
jgi:hypothetical protein